MQGDGGVQKGGECGRHSRASKVRLCILPSRDSGKSHQLRALQEEVWVWVFMLSQRPLGFVVLLLCFIFKKVHLSHCYDLDLDFSLLFATLKNTQAVVDNHLLTRMERVIRPWGSILTERSIQRFLQRDKQGGQGPTYQHQCRDS